MPTNDYSKNIVYLSKEQYQELITNETLTVNGQTITYNDNDIYVTPQAEPITDVKINGTSIGSNGIANIPIASTDKLGLIKVQNDTAQQAMVNGGSVLLNNVLYIVGASTTSIKSGRDQAAVVSAAKIGEAAFYGLAKAARHDEKDSAEPLGTYTPGAKAAIQNMLGITDLISTEESSTATAAHAANSTFMMDGKLHRATAAIAIGDAVEVGTNCEVVKADEVFVKNTDYASSAAAGVVKINYANGISMSTSQNNYGTLYITRADGTQVKVGEESYRPIVPVTQHTAVFYGLSKVAGIDLKNETVALGTYPETSKTAINTLIGSTSQESLDYAGITNRTYTELFNGEFTVTTATTSGWNKPYANTSITPASGDFNRECQYRVTFDGTEYIVPLRTWYKTTINTPQGGNKTIHVTPYPYIGNISLYLSSTNNVPDIIDNVPFILSQFPSGTIKVLTSTAGTHTIKVEKIAFTKKELPPSLIYKNSYQPFSTATHTGEQCMFGISIGDNLVNPASSIAIGIGNEITTSFGTAIGYACKVTQQTGIAIGYGNTASQSGATALGVLTEATGQNSFTGGVYTKASGNQSVALGFSTEASGMAAVAFGDRTIASGGDSVAFGYQSIASGGASCAFGQKTQAVGNMSFAVGNYSQASGSVSYAEGNYSYALGHTSHVEGYFNFAKAKWSHVEGAGTTIDDTQTATHVSGINNITPTTTGKTITVQKKNVDGTATTDEPVSATLGKFAEIVGNGDSDSARSNARALDWSGNEYLAGNVYVGCNSDSTGGIRLPHDIQVNGTSVVNNGIANIPLVDGTTPGVVKTNVTYGTNSSNGYLQVVGAVDAIIKNGTDLYRPIVPARQEQAVFYGLAKAAGDITQAASDNAVGTYTSDASAAIRSMLGAVGTSDYATTSTPGIIKIDPDYGVGIITSGTLAGKLNINKAADSQVQAGASEYRPIVPKNQHNAVFYGLAKAAGDATQSASSNAVGTYTAEAKAAIHTMLGIDPASIAAQVDIPLVETVSGTTPTITGQPNTRYVCGEVSTISITPPASGSVDVIFESGSTATTMTVPSTVKWPAWFDAETLEANTTYEVLITDGIYGSVMTWAT